MKFGVIAVATTCLVLAAGVALAADNVVVLTPDNFDKVHNHLTLSEEKTQAESDRERTRGCETFTH